MILFGTTKLETVLGGAVSANQLDVHVDYVVWNVDGGTSKPAQFRVATNNTTDVTILAAPTLNSYIHEVIRVAIYNKDTASATVTVKTDDATTERIEYKVILGAADTLSFERGRGWYVLDANGSIKSSAPVQLVTGGYTPTLSNTTNVGASTAYASDYFRVGDMVHVFGRFDLDPTTIDTSTLLGMTLPIASNIGALEDLSGTAAARDPATRALAIFGDATNNRASIQGVVQHTDNQGYSFHFSYRII